MHESQHVDLNVSFLEKYGRIRSPYYHHITKGTVEGNFYNERLDFMWQVYPIWWNDYKHRKITGQFPDVKQYIDWRINEFIRQDETKEKDDE